MSNTKVKMDGFVHKGSDNPVFTEQADISLFDTERLRVQVLCQDEEGLYVAHNIPFDEAMKDPQFANHLRCVKIHRDGWNTASIFAALYCENRDFQITDYMHRTKNMYGQTVGGLSVDDFDIIRGVSVSLFREYYGDDSKPGF